MDCLDDDSVLAFLDGDVDDARRALIESHLAGCQACADLIATSAGGAPETLARQSLGDALTVGGSLLPGATVGRYVILNLVGRGGMGEVYAAYDPRLERKVALKLLRPRIGRRKTPRAAQERLLREAQSTARLSHPNVVAVYDAGAFDDEVDGVRVYLAMAFVEGQTLAEWLAAEPRSWRAIRDVFVAAGEGLRAAHEAGLVHRDFKPQNVMIGRDGTVRVMDFGLASDQSDTASLRATTLDLVGAGAQPTAQTIALTETGVLLGTPLYMAPEQFLGRPTDARTDQFGFCVTLYEALYGTRPFQADSFETLMSAVVSGRPREPDRKKGIPGFLRKVALRGLRANPAARYRSMRELLAALRTDPVRRRRIAIVSAAVGTVALAAAFSVQRAATRGQRMCRGADDKLAGIWERDADGPRRAAVHRSFVATGSALAEESWVRVSALLDDYAHRWAAAYTDACEATHIRGDQSDEVLDLRMGCLEGSRRALRALADVLSNADATALVTAVDAAHALPPLDRCADVASLRVVVPLPANATTRARVAALETRLAEVKALSETGGWKEAHEKVIPLVEEVRATGYDPLLAEALGARAWLEQEKGNLRTSLQIDKEATWVALAAHNDDVAAESATLLATGIGAFALGSSEEEERWTHLAEALLERLGPGHDRIVSWLHQGLGIVSLRRHDYRQAATELNLARELKERILPPNHPDIAISLVGLADAEEGLGDTQGALRIAERALAIDRSAYGNDSPLLWDSLEIRGEALTSLHRYRAAESDLRESVTRTAEFLGGNHPWNAYPLTALGKLLLAEDRYSEAASVLERALRVREGAEPRVERVAETRFALAQAYRALDRDRPAARALAIAARETYRILPGYRKEAAEVERWLGDE
ncbi:MAG TPA: tetratricopeptide repeat protein [Polyangia bacterium]|nr:tetratricopeptide repeat protein [Polyangia bacterium]